MNNYEYILIGDFELPLISLLPDNNLLKIVLANNVSEGVLRNLDFSRFDLYNAYGTKMSTYEGYSTIYNYSGNLLQLSNDGSIYVEPKRYQYIQLDSEGSIDVQQLSIDGNILSISLVYSIDINRLINKTITHYSTTNDELGKYVGFNTVYNVIGKTVQLSNDGSVYEKPRQYQYIKLDSGEIIDITEISADNHVLTITFVNNEDNIAAKLINNTITYYSPTNEEINKYIGFNTVYRINEKIVQLSNNESVYVAPREHSYIKLDSGEILDITDIQVNDNILTIIFTNENIDVANLVNNSIAHYSNFHQLISQYDGFDTIYKIYGDTVQLSNDGSVYIEPRQYPYIVINDDESFDVSYVQKDNHVIMVALVDDIDIVDKLVNNDFVLYSNENEKICEYIGYNTLYHVEGSVVYLSDDGTVFPREHSFIIVDRGEMIDVMNVMVDGGILTISLVDDINPEYLIGDSITYYAPNRKKICEFNGFNTIYRINGRDVQMSNDGSVYVEPKDYKYIQIDHGDTINIYNLVDNGKYITVNCVNGSISFDDNIIGEDVVLYSEIDQEIGQYYVYQTEGASLSLSIDKPKQYQHISADQIGDIEIVNITAEGNLLSIECVEENEGLAENLIEKEITVYSTIDIEINKYSGFDTVYQIDNNTIYLSNDGSIAPRDNKCIITSDKEVIDIQSYSIYRNLMDIILLDEDDAVAEKLIAGDFTINDEMGYVIGRYSEYNTIYRINGTAIQLSKDGSVYDPVVERVKELEKAKEEKIESISDSCFFTINYGFFVEIQGEQKHFNFTTEDQQNIKTAFDLAFTTKMSVPYHADGEDCKLYTPEEITRIYIAGQLHVTHHQTYYNQLKQYINSLDNIEDVNCVQYGQRLTGIYLDTYNSIMSQTQNIINAITGVN